MPNALKKITTEAKRMKRLHPSAKWSNLVKQAGAKYRAGKIGTKRKKHTAHRKKRRVGQHAAKVVKRAAVAKVGSHKRKRIRKAGAVVVRTRTVYKTKRVRAVGKSGSSTTPLLIGLGVLAAVLLLKPKQPTVPAGAPPLVLTTNQTRNNQSQAIVNYAVAAGLTIDAIIKLINSLNSQSDAQVKDTYDGVNQSGELPDFIFT